jgi:hypothetical protein
MRDASVSYLTPQPPDSSHFPDFMIYPTNVSVQTKGIYTSPNFGKVEEMGDVNFSMSIIKHHVLMTDGTWSYSSTYS